MFWEKKFTLPYIYKAIHSERKLKFQFAVLILVLRRRVRECVVYDFMRNLVVNVDNIFCGRLTYKY